MYSVILFFLIHLAWAAPTAPSEESIDQKITTLKAEIPKAKFADQKKKIEEFNSWITKELGTLTGKQPKAKATRRDRLILLETNFTMIDLKNNSLEECDRVKTHIIAMQPPSKKVELETSAEEALEVIGLICSK